MREKAEQGSYPGRAPFAIGATERTVPSMQTFRLTLTVCQSENYATSNVVDCIQPCFWVGFDWRRQAG
jgi:hypothetical protein